jgi:hypothetical protein
VPTLTVEETSMLLTTCGVMNAQDSARSARAVVGEEGVAVKKLFTVLELAHEAGSARKVTVDRFCECAGVVGLTSESGAEKTP